MIYFLQIPGGDPVERKLQLTAKGIIDLLEKHKIEVKESKVNGSIKLIAVKDGSVLTTVFVTEQEARNRVNAMTKSAVLASLFAESSYIQVMRLMAFKKIDSALQSAGILPSLTIKTKNHDNN